MSGVEIVETAHKSLHVPSHSPVTVEGDPEVEVIVLDNIRLIGVVRPVGFRGTASRSEEKEKSCQQKEIFL